MTKRTGMVQTVNGLITPDQLGLTLMHEHLLCDLSVRFKEPEESTKRAFAHQPFTAADRWRVLADLTSNRDNLVLDNVEASAAEAMHFKQSGGRTIVDQTTRGLGRDPTAIRAIANLTGLNVVMGTGYYVHLTHPADLFLRHEQDIADEMTREIVEGIGNTGVRCGIIGEIGVEVLSDNELKVLRAAAIAQRQTGALVTVHTMYLYSGAEGGIRIANELQKAGADLSRVVFCHQDGSGVDVHYQEELLKRGIILEYDLFGFEVAFEASGQAAQWPSDAQRINELSNLLDRGWIKQVLISHDVCVKFMTRAYGGWGYAHLLDVVRSHMNSAGITDELITTMMVESPSRLLPLVNGSR